MSLQQLEQPPPYSRQLDENDLPSVPRDNLRTGRAAAAKPNDANSSPPLSIPAVASSSPQSLYSIDSRGRHVVIHPNQLPNAPTATPGRHATPSDSENAMALDETPRSAESGLSAEDLIVAEALTDLRQFGSPPPLDSPAARARAINSAPNPDHGSQEPEPLLSLLNQSHPWLGGTINGSLSAYASTKSYSPRFVQYGVDFVERNVGSTVETVGKRTGVEGRLRHYLDSRRPSDLERADPGVFGQDSANKRRSVVGNEEAMEVDESAPQDSTQTRSKPLSPESLPAYDEARSPPYEEDLSLSPSEQTRRSQQRAVNRSWSAQLMISTSGLGAALSESSLKSLKLCLGILRGANKHVRDLMLALKRLLDEYEQTSTSLEEGQSTQSTEKSSTDQNMMDVDSTSTSRDVHTYAERIKQLNEEIWNTVKSVVNTVSRYTGGALPENASAMVRIQLLSVPRRYQRALSESVPITDEQPATDTVSNAHRMLTFAREGLEMMANVGGVIESTIVSAERWLDTMGRRRGESSEQGGARALLDSKEDSTNDAAPERTLPTKEG